jgi:hypothetical protein
MTRSSVAAASRVTSRVSVSATSSAVALRDSSVTTRDKCASITRKMAAAPRTAAPTAVVCVCGHMARCKTQERAWFYPAMRKDSHSLL